MARTRPSVLLLLVTLCTAAACADTDPKYGPPGVIRGLEIDFGGGGDAATAPIPEAGPSTKPAAELFADLFATITDTTEAKGSPCVPCHGTTQAPVFMAATAEETRTKFKAAGYEKLATSRFYLKGAHTGKELTPAQKALTQQWAAAEAGDGG